MRDRYKIIFAIAVPVLFLTIVFMTTGIFFETNDDKLMADILSGALVDKPDAHVVFVNYLLALPLSGLYSITSQINWYGCMFVLLHFLAYFAMMWSTYERCNSKKHVFMATITWLFFFLINYYTTALVQFTSTGILLAVAGYVCLLLQKKRKNGLVLFFILELLAFFMRSESMLMIQPIGGGVYFLLSLMEKHDDVRTKSKEITKFVGCIVAVLLIGCVGNWLGYGSEWDEYTRFRKARSTIFDYYGVSPYEEVKEILDKYQVSEIEYNGFCNYTIIDWEVPLECLEELVDYAKSKNQKSFDIAGIFNLVKSAWVGNGYMGNREVCVGSILCAMALIVLAHKWRLIPSIVCLLVTHTCILGYLMMQGRTPLRVMQPFMVCLVFFLFALLWREIEEVKVSKWAKGVLLIAGCLWCVVCLRAGRIQYKWTESNNSGQEAFIEGLVEIMDYCKQNPENGYLLDTWSFSYYVGSVLETRIYQNTNCITCGNWYSNSPVLGSYTQEFLHDKIDNLYYITCDKGMGQEDPVLLFWEEKTGKEAELVDNLTVSYGGSYQVYSFN